MFNPSQRGSWRNFIICMGVIALYILYISLSSVLDSHSYIFLIIPIGIILCFIIGIIWRPNFRKSHYKQPEEEEKDEKEEKESGWTNLRY